MDGACARPDQGRASARQRGHGRGLTRASRHRRTRSSERLGRSGAHGASARAARGDREVRESEAQVHPRPPPHGLSAHEAHMTDLQNLQMGPVTEAEWAEHRRQAMQALPAELEGKPLPAILLPYQRERIEAVDRNALVVDEKSRRIGATWGIGAVAVLISGAARAAGGMDTLYIGYNLDMAREFIDACAMWAKTFGQAVFEVGEYLFTEEGERGEDRAIKAFRIRFASGFEIVALSSRPRSLRGRQGFVILDEFAFHDDAEELLKAAMALLIW